MHIAATIFALEQRKDMVGAKNKCNFSQIKHFSFQCSKNSLHLMYCEPATEARCNDRDNVK